MSTILPHMMWPYLITMVRIKNAGLKCAARGSLKMQDAKIMQKNGHLRTITQLCWAVSSQLKRVSTIGKILVKWQYLLRMSSQYGELCPING